MAVPGENVQAWSITAALNSSADILANWAEGMPRADVNNSARSMMAAHAKDRDLKNGSIVTGGTANAQTFTSGVGYTIVPTGLTVMLKIGPTLTNTAATTLDMDGIGAVNIQTQRAHDLTGGEMIAGTYCRLLYDGTVWRLLDVGVGQGQIVNISNVIITASDAPAAFIDFTNLDTALFQSYQIICTNFVPEIAEAALCLNASNDNGVTFPFVDVTEYNSSETYASQAVYLAGGMDASQFSQSDQGYLAVTWGIDTTESFPGSTILDLFGFGADADISPSFNWRSTHYHASTFFSTVLDGSGYMIATGACNAIRLWPTSGNIISGTFALYGARV